MDIFSPSLTYTALLHFPPKMFTVKMQEGVVASSYSAGDKFFIDPMKLVRALQKMAPVLT